LYSSVTCSQLLALAVWGCGGSPRLRETSGDPKGVDPCRNHQKHAAVHVTPKLRSKSCTESSLDCHFDLSQAADFATALTNSLGSIVNSMVSCDYAVPAAPAGKTIDPEQIVLVYNEGNGNYSLILQNTSANCDKGWQFTDATNSKIHICGSTCNLIQSNAAAQLNLVFGCGVSQVVN
jgi:hypothetical protein